MADLRFTATLEGMNGALSAVEQLVRDNPGFINLRQFNNPANPRIHRETTAMEILRDTDVRVDTFVTGVGTVRTITGVGEALR